MRCARRPINSTRSGTTPPVAVPPWPTVKATKCPAVKSVLVGVDVIRPLSFTSSSLSFPSPPNGITSLLWTERLPADGLWKLCRTAGNRPSRRAVIS